jgi:hypothetical protein
MYTGDTIVEDARDQAERFVRWARERENELGGHAYQAMLVSAEVVHQIDERNLLQARWVLRAFPFTVPESYPHAEEYGEALDRFYI